MLMTLRLLTALIALLAQIILMSLIKSTSCDAVIVKILFVFTVCAPFIMVMMKILDDDIFS